MVCSVRGGCVMDVLLFILLACAGRAMGRPDAFIPDLFRNHISSTSRYDFDRPVFSTDTFPREKPSSGSSSGFWGLPPPPDSPYMGSLSTSRDLLSPPTKGPERREETTTTSWLSLDNLDNDGRQEEGYGDRGGLEGRRPTTQRLPAEPSPDTGNLARKWCSRYESNCRSPKREANDLSIRITGGEPAPPKEHPYMVMIGYGPESRREWLCGGSLISEKFVLSAAHCVNTTKLGQARWARLGELDTSTSRDDARPQEREIVERLVYPGYREPRVYHDIALLKLDREVTFTPWVSPICLQTTEEPPTTFATITGWGRTDFVSDTSSSLMEVDIRIFNTSACKSMINPGAGNKMPRGFDPRSMICAGVERGGKDACQGDSGGPLVVEGGCARIQVGITSVGKECGLPKSPGVYTRVYSYVSWIENIVWG